MGLSTEAGVFFGMAVRMTPENNDGMPTEILTSLREEGISPFCVLGLNEGRNDVFDNKTQHGCQHFLIILNTYHQHEKFENSKIVRLPQQAMFEHVHALRSAYVDLVEKGIVEQEKGLDGQNVVPDSRFFFYGETY